MIVVNDACFRCGVCIQACPVPGTITNAMPGRVRVNSFTCIGCEQCLPRCSANALSVAPDPTDDTAVTEAPAKKSKRR